MLSDSRAAVLMWHHRCVGVFRILPSQGGTRLQCMQSKSVVWQPRICSALVHVWLQAASVDLLNRMFNAKKCHCTCLSCFAIQHARTLIEYICVCMLSASHVVDAYPANTSESLEYGEAMQPYHACVWLTGSCEGDVFLVVYTFGVCRHCQIHVRSLRALPDTRSESGDATRYPFGVWWRCKIYMILAA